MIAIIKTQDISREKGYFIDGQRLVSIEAFIEKGIWYPLHRSSGIVLFRRLSEDQVGSFGFTVFPAN